MSLSQPVSTPATATTKLSVEHVSMVFERDGKTTHVLNDLNLEVADGEFVGQIGDFDYFFWGATYNTEVISDSGSVEDLQEVKIQEKITLQVATGAFYKYFRQSIGTTPPVNAIALNGKRDRNGIQFPATPTDKTRAAGRA